ncbi:MAG: RnfABCDGE type electron transport complex subunit B [Clostridia bacterium]|nr:RnfABCDGE type electron transport complex subunit B [Clostridia bacterium]
MLEAVLYAVVSVTVIGLLCAVMLVVAAKFMSVPENETKKALRECLPGANCGACGYTGCDGYAEALCNGEKTNLCIPGGDATSKAISDTLGVEFVDTIEQAAVVRCCGDCNVATIKAEYDGIKTCAGAMMIYGGEKLCTYGCLGFGDCANACPNDAICIENGIAHVDPRRCTGCGLCAKTCPNSVIEMRVLVKNTAISCSNKEKGAVARNKCKNACIACKKCEKTCPEGAITVADNLASIDYSKCTNCGACVEACPVGCIKKVG